MLTIWPCMHKALPTKALPLEQSTMQRYWKDLVTIA